MNIQPSPSMRGSGGAALQPSQLVYDPLHLHARKQGLSAILQAALYEEGQNLEQQQQQHHSASPNALEMKRQLARAVVAGAMKGVGGGLALDPRHRSHNHHHSTITSSSATSSCSCSQCYHNMHDASESCSCTDCNNASTTTCSCSTTSNYYFSANTSSCSQCIQERYQQQRFQDYYDEGGCTTSRRVRSEGDTGGELGAPSPMQSADPYQLSAPSVSSRSRGSNSSGVRRTMMAGLDFSLDPPEAPTNMLSTGGDDGQFIIPTGHIAGRAFIDELDMSTGGYVPPPQSHYSHNGDNANIHLTPSRSGVVPGPTPQSQSAPPASTEVPNHVLTDILLRLEALKEEQRISKQQQPTALMIDPVPQGGADDAPPQPLPHTTECDTQTSFNTVVADDSTPPQKDPNGDGGTGEAQATPASQTDIPNSTHPQHGSSVDMYNLQGANAVLEAEVQGRMCIIHQEEQEVLVSVAIPLMLLLIQQPPAPLPPQSSSLPSAAELNRGTDIVVMPPSTDGGVENDDDATLGGAVVKLLSTAPSERVAGRYGGAGGSCASSISSSATHHTINNGDDAVIPTSPSALVDDQSALSDAKRVFMLLDGGDESNDAVDRADQPLNNGVENTDAESIPSKIVSQASFDLAQALWRDLYPTVRKFISSHRPQPYPSIPIYTPPPTTIIHNQQLDDNGNADQYTTSDSALTATTLLTPLDRAALVLSSLYARIAPSSAPPKGAGDAHGGDEIDENGIQEVDVRVASSLREAIETALFNSHGTHWLSPVLTSTMSNRSNSEGDAAPGVLFASTTNTASSLAHHHSVDSNIANTAAQRTVVSMDCMSQLIVVHEEEMSSRGLIRDHECDERGSLLQRFHTSLWAIYTAESSRTQQHQIDAITEAHATEIGMVREEMVAAAEASLGGYREDINRLRKDLTASHVQCAGLHARLQKLLLMPVRSEGANTTITASSPREKEDAALPIHERFARAHRQALSTIHHQL